MSLFGRRHFALFTFSVVVLSVTQGQAAETPSVAPLFQIDGKGFTTKDLTPADQNRLHELEVNRYRAIESLARQRYVELKSEPYKSLNSQKQPFAAEEKWLNQKFAPTSAEIDKALEAFKDEKQLQQLPVAERGQVMERYLTSQKRMKALTEATDKALQKGEIRIGLRAPEAPVFDISKSSQPVIGDAKNTIRVVEFTDFQCPYCKRLSAATGEVLKKYGSRIVWEVRHFPLSFHKQAKDAAAAVYCASVQGKLVDAKKWVFEAQEKLGEENIFARMSAELKLNDKEFNKCRKLESTAQLIESDIREGERIGVSGTPTVFVNGRRFQGDPQSIEAWDEMLKAVPHAASEKHSM